MKERRAFIKVTGGEPTSAKKDEFEDEINGLFQDGWDLRTVYPAGTMSVFVFERYVPPKIGIDGIAYE